MMIETRPIKPRFIALEGIDGIGKTEQAGRLTTALRLLYPDQQVRTLRDPGSTDAGESIRRILEERRDGMDPMTELFLRAAARRHLVSESLSDWLEAGDIVIADQFTGYTLAYLGEALHTHPNYRDSKEGQLDEILDHICALSTDGWLANPGLNILYEPPWDDADFDAIINRNRTSPLSPAERDCLEGVCERYSDIAKDWPSTWTSIQVAVDQSADSVAAATLEAAIAHFRAYGLPEPNPRPATLLAWQEEILAKGWDQPDAASA